MFFITMILFINGRSVTMDNLAQAMNFRNRSACYAEAAARARIIRRAGVHGRFLCMYDREPDAALHREDVVNF